MSDERDEMERRLKREDLFKLAAVAGGASLFASRTGVAKGALARLTAESGRLQVLDWAGYGNDGGQSMFAQYVKAHAADKPQFTYMTNESDALAKLHAGLKPDIFRPYVGWVKYFATSGLVEPWDTSLISNFKHLNPFMVKAGQYNGKQYGIPGGLGLRRDPLPNRQGDAEGAFVGSALRRPVQGQDRVVRRPRHARRRRASTSGSRIRGTSPTRS